MPTRRKNVELSRLKRTSKKSRFYEYLSSAYVQYLLIFLIWGVLLLVNQSTEMRFEYFWPGWLFICSIHDSLKYHGMVVRGIFLIRLADQGLCFLTLTFCFMIVYFELGFHSKGVKLNPNIYLFRPFAAHSIGYPVVCMGFSIKRYLDVRHRKLKKMEVCKQNCLYFRILREAVPYSAIQEFSGMLQFIAYYTPGTTYPTVYLPDCVGEAPSMNDDEYPVTSSAVPWSPSLLQQLGKSLCSRFPQWTLLHPILFNNGCHSLGTPSYTGGQSSDNNNNSITQTIANGSLPLSGTGAITTNATSSSSTIQTSRRNALLACSETTTPSGRRAANLEHSNGGTNGATSETAHSKGGKQSHSTGRNGTRYVKEDPTTRLENNVRRLRTEVQSMRAVESQLRNQVTHLEMDDRVNRLQLSEQRHENQSLAADLAKLATQSRSERSSRLEVEQSLSEEKRLRLIVEEQLVELEPWADGVAQEEIEDSLGATTESRTTKALDADSSAPDGSDGSNSNSNNLDTGSMNTTDFTEPACCQHRIQLESELYTQRMLLRQQDEQLRAMSGARARQANHNQQQQQQHHHHQQQQLHHPPLINMFNRSALWPPTQSQQATNGLSNGLESKVKRTARLVLKTDGEGEEQADRDSSSMTTMLGNSVNTSLDGHMQRAKVEKERLNSTLREENRMKELLLTHYHDALREISDLNRTHKQRDFQIHELQLKVDQFERAAVAVASKYHSGRTRRVDVGQVGSHCGKTATAAAPSSSSSAAAGSCSSNLINSIVSATSSMNPISSRLPSSSPWDMMNENTSPLFTTTTPAATVNQFCGDETFRSLLLSDLDRSGLLDSSSSAHTLTSTTTTTNTVGFERKFASPFQPGSSLCGNVGGSNLATSMDDNVPSSTSSITTTNHDAIHSHNNSTNLFHSSEVSDLTRHLIWNNHHHHHSHRPSSANAPFADTNGGFCSTDQSKSGGLPLHHGQVTRGVHQSHHNHHHHLSTETHTDVH